MHPPRRARRSREGRRYGSALVLVGAAATAYHAASGRLRRHLRKLDYWTISLASTRLLEALAPARHNVCAAPCRQLSVCCALSHPGRVCEALTLRAPGGGAPGG